jgi:hypothetical protein
MSHKPPRCDSCNNRIRTNQHALRLSDLLTGQVLGLYHGRPDCMESAVGYITGGTALRASVLHPPRCGDDMEDCDGGFWEWLGVAA